jgi:RNA polymerase sigma-70 factor (ECF subfamily)
MSMSTIESSACAFDEAELLRQASGGDQDAFSRLVDSCRGGLYRAAYYLTGCPATAEDAVQNALLKAWNALPMFRGDSRFSTWTTRIVLNEVHMIRRRADYKRVEYVADMAALERSYPQPFRSHHASCPEATLISSDQRAFLWKAVRSLPRSLRCVIEYDLTHDSGIHEAAEELGLSSSAIKSRRMRARRELQKRVQNRIAAPERHRESAPGGANAGEQVHTKLLRTDAHGHCRLAVEHL